MAIHRFCAAAALTSACAPPVLRPVQGEAQRPDGFPIAHYQRAAELGEAIFRIDDKRSLVVIEVRRGGSLAQAGHDHVVASHDVQGFVAPREARADLYVPLDRLVVDEPEIRSEAGFDTQIPDAAISATRANMLAHVLRAEAHPFALVSIAGVDANRYLDVALTLNGVTRTTRIVDHWKSRSRPNRFRHHATVAPRRRDSGARPRGGAVFNSGASNGRVIAGKAMPFGQRQILARGSAIVTSSTAPSFGPCCIVGDFADFCCDLGAIYRRPDWHAT